MKHYYQSNKGPVNLCIKCEPTILDRSFGKVDAMDKSNSFDHYNSKEVKHRI